MEERDSRERCWVAEWSLLFWSVSRAQTAHCSTLFIFLKVLGFSPALMEVGRYVVDTLSLDLSGCIYVCMWAHYISNISEMGVRPGGRWKRKWIVYGYESDELSPIAPHSLTGISSTTDTGRQKSHLCFSSPFNLLKLSSHPCFEAVENPK